MTMPISPKLLKKLRLTHLYLGVFAAPAILFFAITGAIQTFGLHEASPNGSYQPPRIVLILAQIHKKQTASLPIRKDRPSDLTKHTGEHDREHAGPAGNAAAQPLNAPRRSPLPLKIFFLLIAISLVASTFSGLYMTYAYNRNKTLIVSLLLLGTVVPVLLTIL